jgi:hypothetical protein
MSKNNNFGFDWLFWFLWLMATTVGWVISQLLLTSIGPLVAGFTIGVMQWFVLRDRITNAWRWILATGVGWGLGTGIVLFVIPDEYIFPYGIIVGTTTGVSQWWILRGEVYFSGWWILISIIAWFTGLSMVPGLLTTGTLPGVLTGIALELLLRNPKPTTDVQIDVG